MKESESLVGKEIDDVMVLVPTCAIKKGVKGLSAQLGIIADILEGQKSHRLQMRLLEISRLLLMSVSNCECSFPRISKIKTVMRVKTALMECQDCLILAKILNLYDASPQLLELSKLMRSVESACKY